MSFWKDMLTENNGASYCPVRVGLVSLFSTSMPTVIGGAVFDLYKNGHLDYVQFCSGVALIATSMTALAGGIAMKAKTDTPNA